MWQQMILVILGLALGGCSTAKKPYRPVRQELTPDQVQQLAKVEGLWRREDPKFAAARDQVLGDPVTAAWWSRTLLYYAVGSYQQHLRRQRDVLGTVQATEPLGYKKALTELKVVGSVAVPVVVAELLRHHDTKNRAVGVRILVHMGPDIVTDLEPYLAHEDKRVSRQVLEALGGLATDDRACTLLQEYSHNEDWSLRAQALESLAMAGEDQLPRLHQAVLQDPDPFVRRRVVSALGRFKDKKTATLVVAYYKEVLRKNDRQGIRAAQQTLQSMSGLRGNRTEIFWERWLDSLPTKS